MSVLDQLSSSLQRKDEVPNQELAARIAAAGDRAAVQELIDNLQHKNKAIQQDCIKVLYETGSLNPALVAPHIAALEQLLTSKNNRLQWGAMTALDTVTDLVPDQVYAILGKIIAVADRGSVITKDHAVGILVRLSTHPEYYDDALALLLEQLLKAAPNQLPMYAEQSLPIIRADHKQAFIDILHQRLPDVPRESKINRIQAVIRKARQL
ncbi:hypothetical protein [Taibaiella chishuiensis]|uniref:HEAT repeat protein n=1 Tax=Taibaiella chishuiensis TaxID=1434707 RepID=A0A2P8CYP1_9BACT|nr:hypothetical protein [Taibaiella chishuiensis]PSK90095.1 hypothetical protein B0I18_109101 [Taibaiella chishuiensis]